MRRVLAVVPDLFFAAKIAATAKAVGVQLVTCSPAKAAEAAREGSFSLILFDLHAEGDPLAAARALEADPATAAIPVLGFHSHVEAALRHDALAAGVDVVLPRSAFSAKLPEILSGALRRLGGKDET